MTDESLVTLGGAAWREEDPAEGHEDERSDEAQHAEESALNVREEREIFGPDGDDVDQDDESSIETEGLSPVNIRNFSVKCAYCGNYQVIVGFRPIDEDWNEYVYECDQPPCCEDVERSRTVLEIPSALDEYARRDPTWHGGEVHAGAKYDPE